jgi:hypothetical protein
MNDSTKPRLSRRIALLGTSAMLGAAGVGTYLIVSASSAGAHLTRATVHAHAAAAHVAAAPVAAAPVKAAPAAAPAVDPDNIQSGDQTGPDTTTGGTDSAAASAGESSGAEADGAGGWADPAGSTGVNGDFNN